jgi:hypothetical protein
MATNKEATSSATKYARYIHQLLCSPPAATFFHALQKSKELTTIPGLTPALISTHLPQSTTTNKGHMRRDRANMASTHNAYTNIMAAYADVNSMSPTQNVCSLLEMFFFTTLANTNTGTMYTDLTGAFPIRSFKNMQYIFVAYMLIPIWSATYLWNGEPLYGNIFLPPYGYGNPHMETFTIWGFFPNPHTGTNSVLERVGD